MAEAEQKPAEETGDNQNNSENEMKVQEESTENDNSQAESSTEKRNGLQYERHADREINLTTRRLDISEICFRMGYPCEIQSLSRYHGHEWMEAEHLFKTAIDFAEEVYNDWSPCSSPSPTSFCL